MVFFMIMGVSALSAEGLSISKKHGPFYRYQRYVVLHHTQVSATRVPYQLSIVDNDHRQRFYEEPSALGYRVGYTFFCKKDGTLVQTRLVGEMSAAQLEHNFDSISICLAGDFDKEEPTKAQIKTLREFLKIFQNYEFIFHRELAGDKRSCPGRKINRKRINELMGENWVAIQTEVRRRNHLRKRAVHKDK